MQDARDTGRTCAIPSRRNLLAGASAALLAGAAIVTQAKGTPAKPVQPMLAFGAAADDAELIALADRIMADDSEMDRLQTEAEDAGRDDGRFYHEVVQPHTRRCWDMRARLAILPATTLAGFRAKARVLQRFNNCIGGGASAYSDDALAWSLANDLLGVASEFEADGEGAA